MQMAISPLLLLPYFCGTCVGNLNLYVGGHIISVATLLWPSVGWSPTLGKSEDLESSGTPECLEFDSKAQNTSHWGVLGVIGKVLKRRYRKWPRIGHLDICSPSYGQKKGRESNWQFDSRPLKVRNRPLPDLRIESAIRRWKDLDDGYKFGSDLVAIRLCSRELWAPKVLGLDPGQFRDNFGTPTRESRGSRDSTRDNFGTISGLHPGQFRDNFGTPPGTISGQFRDSNLGVPGLHLGQFRDNFGTPTRESREKVTFRRGCRGVSQSIL
jgi:hypothetical protein